MSDGRPWDWRDNSAFTSAEIEAISRVLADLDAALEATSARVPDDEFIATGWPDRIEPNASAALRLMESRGRFSEELEQGEPSNG